MDVTRVDFVVNCYERTYRHVLEPGFIRRLASQQGYPFSCVTALINNVNERWDAERMAALCDVDRVVFVVDEIEQAMKRTGVSDRSLRRLRHFSDCCLVAVTLDGPDWLVYWDADAELSEQMDWVAPCISYASSHLDIAIFNPNNWHVGLAEWEALNIDGLFAIGFGFSDVVFLARRSELGRRVYGYIAPASWRYPLAHIEAIFEQRVDAYMRRRKRLRATYLPASVTHPAEVGLNYPLASRRERVRRRLLLYLGRVASKVNHP